MRTFFLYHQITSQRFNNSIKPHWGLDFNIWVWGQREGWEAQTTLVLLQNSCSFFLHATFTRLNICISLQHKLHVGRFPVSSQLYIFPSTLNESYRQTASQMPAVVMNHDRQQKLNEVSLTKTAVVKLSWLPLTSLPLKLERSSRIHFGPIIFIPLKTSIVSGGFLLNSDNITTKSIRITKPNQPGCHSLSDAI